MNRRQSMKIRKLLRTGTRGWQCRQRRDGRYEVRRSHWQRAWRPARRRPLTRAIARKAFLFRGYGHSGGCDHAGHAYGAKMRVLQELIQELIG